MHICTITSKLMPVTQGQGYYESEVHVPFTAFNASHAPREYVNKEISRHIAGCVASTKLPLNERIWTVSFTEEAMRIFNYPAKVIA